MKNKIALILASALACALAVGAANFFRYQVAPLERIPAVARLDRWSGEVVIVAIDGRELGRYPSFDPIRDGLAVQLSR
jgi:hypothetical protein